jgi:beta-hydroxylase
VLHDNWRTIRDEGMKLLETGDVDAAARRAATAYNDIGFNSFFRTGWKRFCFYLTWYDEPLASATALCPKTVARCTFPDSPPVRRDAASERLSPR